MMTGSKEANGHLDPNAIAKLESQKMLEQHEKMVLQRKEHEKREEERLERERQEDHLR